MWLLDTEKIQLRWFPTPTDVPYAALSHVWTDDEQTFQDTPQLPPTPASSSLWRDALRIARIRAIRRPSINLKVRNACIHARRHGFRWLWVDTCCIDKTNNTELSEAINSMYLWYRTAAMCYAYLGDVPHGQDPHAPRSAFRRSKWFTRGWTLQELIAPASVIFLSQDWTVIGSKWRLAPLLDEITGIDHRVLTHRRPLNDVSVACRMSWAAGRETTRVEDEAYSLMGLFGVYIPTIYGEGQHAFLRLQDEIIRKLPDQSIFAWGLTLKDHDAGTFVATAGEDYDAPIPHLQTLLALSPARFARCGGINPIPFEEFAERLGIQETVPEYTDTSFGIRTMLPVVSIARTSSVDVALAFLACEDADRRLVALYLSSHPRMSASSKYLVGGYIAREGKQSHYYRATRLGLPYRPRSLSSHHDHGSESIQPSWREVHVLSNPDTSERLRLPAIPGADSSMPCPMVLFEAPCTIVLSKRSVRLLRTMGYAEPKVPHTGVLLQTPGEHRSISFLGPVSFTVELGVCSLLLPDTRTQASQLWASVRFDDTKSPVGSDASAAPAADTVDPKSPRLVQAWKNGSRQFRTTKLLRQVELTFSYPWSYPPEHVVAEVYQLGIRCNHYVPSRRVNAV